MTNIERLKKLKEWIKKASRDCRDKDNRGFVDELTLINDFLGDLEIILNYVDAKQLFYYQNETHYLKQAIKSIKKENNHDIQDIKD